MNQLLFVDDEPDVLEGLKDVFRADRARWSVSFATGGEAALAELEQRPFDLVVTDVRMPTIDGLALLRRVRDDYPRTTRVVLSGQADLGIATRVSALAHRYLVKPCPARALRAHVERALALRSLLASDHLREAVGGLGPLPSAPRVYSRLTAALADPGTDLKPLADIVKGDVDLTVRVLRFANSAYCGFSNPLTSIEAAVVRLGLNALRHLALTVEAFSSAGSSPELEALERHALLTGSIARLLVTRPQDQEVAFTAGLLHEAGTLVFVTRVPDEHRTAREAAREAGMPLATAEREVLGASHAEVAAYLLSLWDLPHALIEPIALHHDLDKLGATGMDVTAALALADVLADEVAGVAPDAGAAAVLERLAPLGELAAWRALARTAWAGLRAAEARA